RAENEVLEIHEYSDLRGPVRLHRPSPSADLTTCRSGDETLSQHLARRGARSLVVHVLAPVRRHAARRPGHALVDRVVLRRRELGTLVGLLGFVAVEPVLTWLETADERVPRSRVVRGRVLHGRGVAAADVPALRAPAQVNPPAARGLALDA